MEENRTNRTEKKSMEARKKVICDLMNDPIYVPMKEIGRASCRERV